MTVRSPLHEKDKRTNSSMVNNHIHPSQHNKTFLCNVSSEEYIFCSQVLVSLKLFYLVLFFCFCFCHTLYCLRLSIGSVPRNHSQRCSRDSCGTGFWKLNCDLQYAKQVLITPSMHKSLRLLYSALLAVFVGEEREETCSTGLHPNVPLFH